MLIHHIFQVALHEVFLVHAKALLILVGHGNCRLQRHRAVIVVSFCLHLRVARLRLPLAWANRSRYSVSRWSWWSHFDTPCHMLAKVTSCRWAWVRRWSHRCIRLDASVGSNLPRVLQLDDADRWWHVVHLFSRAGTAHRVADFIWNAIKKKFIISKNENMKKKNGWRNKTTLFFSSLQELFSRSRWHNLLSCFA